MVQDTLFRRSLARLFPRVIAMAILTPGLVLGAAVSADANGTGGNGKDNGSADQFRVVLNGLDVEIYIDGNLSQSVPFDTITSLTVEGSSDDDTLTVDLSGGNPIPLGGLTFNGRNQFSKDTLCLNGGSATSIIYNFLNRQDGTVDVDGRIITYTGLEPIVDTVPAATFTVNGTNTANTINYSVGTSAANGLVAVDDFETIEFSNKTNLIINALGGADTITLNNPNTPTGLNGTITVNGGDTLIVNGIPGQLDNLRYLPTSFGAGTIINDSAPQRNVLFTGIEHLTIVTQQVDGDAIRVDGTLGNDAIEFFQGLTDDSGVFTGNMDQNNATGAGPFAMTPMTFVGSSPAGNDSDINFFNPGGTDSLVFNATGENDFITVQTGEAGGIDFRNTVNGVIASRLEVFNISGGGLVRTLGGNNTVNVNVPAGPAAFPLRIEGGSGSNVLNFSANVASTTNLGTGTISGAGFNTVTYSGIGILNVNSNNTTFNLSATSGDDQLEVTPTAANAMTARIISAVPAVGATPIVNGTGIATFNVDLLGGSNQLTVNGTQSGTSFTITGAQVTTPGGRIAVNYSNAQALTVNGLAGNDTFTVTPSATTGIFVDGGDPTGAGDVLRIVSAAGDTVQFSDGATQDSGTYLVNANQPVSFAHFGPPTLLATKAAVLFTDNGNAGVADPGDTIRYTLTVTNSGSLTVFAGSLSDIPTNSSLVAGSVITNKGTVVTGNTAGDTSVAVNLGTFDIAQPATITFDVVVAASIPAGTAAITNTAQVSALGISAFNTNTTSVAIENVAPSITGVTGPADGIYLSGQDLDFAVTYDEAVTVNTAGGTPTIGLTIGFAARKAEYVSGTGTTTLTFRYALTADDRDLDGIASASPIALNNGTIRDAVGNDASLTFTPPVTTGVLVNGVPPSITSGPTATPNPAGVGQSVSFSVAATGGFAALTIGWNFGDGSTGTGASTTHSYTAAGQFTVTVSVSDGVNPAVTGTVSVTVNALPTPEPSVPVVGSGADSDGDGFSDSFESAVGTDPNSATSTPTGSAATAAAVKKLSILKAKIKLNFARPGSDSIGIRGGLLIPEGFDPSGKTVYLDIGGVTKKFVLNAKGMSPKSNDLFAVSVKSTNGEVPLQISRYSIKLSRGNFASSLADDGLTNTTVSKSVTIPITLIFNGEILQKALTQAYRARAGNTGFTK